MKVKVLNQTIDKQRCFTFYIEDVNTNTLIHSDTFIRTKETNFKQLKAGFVEYVTDMKKMELSMLQAKVHSLDENKHVIDLNNISNNSTNVN